MDALHFISEYWLVCSGLIAVFFALCFNKWCEQKVISYGMSMIIMFSIICAVNIMFKHGDFQGSFYFTSYKVEILRFLPQFGSNLAMRFDRLSMIMLTMVSIVSSCVHLYSALYMKTNTSNMRFMIYISLFTFFMNVLIVANDMMQLFLAWEAVGVMSYLLIGFWFDDRKARNASMKAFIVNRVGDGALLFGIIVLFARFGRVDVFDGNLHVLQPSIEILGYKCSTLSLGMLMVIIGCFGKSAQLGLHIWLPDAMTGPTPASALIHAATMVTAGVFLLVRCSWMNGTFIACIVMIVGALTAFLAAMTACYQNDLKKVLAYSTCSQLGYMFFAAGVQAYDAAIFHLVNHAFFKALLFLTAGKIIEYFHNNQNIKEMSCTPGQMPFTYAVFMIGNLALVGIYPFSGYYSKHAILAIGSDAAMNVAGIAYFSYVMILLAGAATAFYSTRVVLMLFHNRKYDGYAFYRLARVKLQWSAGAALVILVFGAIFSGRLLNNYLVLHENIPNLTLTKDTILQDGMIKTMIALGSALAFINHFMSQSFGRCKKRCAMIINSINPLILCDIIYDIKRKGFHSIANLCAVWSERHIMSGIPKLCVIAVNSVARMHRLFYVGSLSRYLLTMFITFILIIYVSFLCF